MTTLAAVTAADLSIRYPVFAGVAEPTVTAILDEARGSIGEGWIDADRKPALLALCAHLLVGAGALGEDDGYTASGAPLAGMRAGDHEIKFVSGSGSKAGGTPLKGYAATTFGQRYLELRNRSFPNVLVI